MNSPSRLIKTSFLWLLLCCLLACGENPAPINTDRSMAASSRNTWTRGLSKQKRYRIEVHQDYSRIPLGTMHTWEFSVMLADGTPISPSKFEVSGSMPGHGHGMTTFPRSKITDKPGLVVVEGMKFHMSGDWLLHLNINGDSGTDIADLKVKLQPPPVSKQASLFSRDELALLKSLWIDSLPEPPQDPSNRFSGNTQAISLGESLFFDEKLSASGTVSCATCHQPENFFTDGQVKSEGTLSTQRHAPSLIGAVYSQWFYWDGRRDSLWSQAITPIETHGEMDSTRVDAVRFVITHAQHGPKFASLTGHNEQSLVRVPQKKGIGPFSDEQGQQAWNKLHGPSQERINSAFADVGKIIAAYEETLLPEISLFDQFVEKLLTEGDTAAAKIFNPRQINGAKLFINSQKTDCLRCHNGPMWTNQEFHNIATAMDLSGNIDTGRVLGLQSVKQDIFSCTGAFNDAAHRDCLTLNTVRPNHLDSGAFKTPTLRNISRTAPYMHHGEMNSLEQVMHHYRFPPAGPPDSHEIPTLSLSDHQANDLIAFLKTL